MRRCLEQLQSRSHYRRPWVPSSLAPLRVRSRNHALVSTSPFQVCISNLPRRSISSRRSRSRDVSNSHLRNPPLDTTTPGKGRTRRADQEHVAAERLPEHWVGLLERFLPRQLSQASQLEFQNIIPGELSSQDVLRILSQGRAHTAVDILGFMVLEQNRYKAVIHLVDILLKAAALAANQPFEEELPSNINWPFKSFAESFRHPIELDYASHVHRLSPGHSVSSFDNTPSPKDQDATMEVVWSFLADLVLASTKRPFEQAKPIMNTVHQVLALVHNLGLVPENIYNYELPRATTILQHPPILHLLNSRILSTLSDAVWRAHQEEALSREGKEDPDTWSFFQDAPGSRFRLKVRELGPEVWMEFILWCCLEGGFAPTAARVVKSLREDSEQPWRAVHWTTGQGIDDRVPPIDWNRLNKRSSGPVSQREGYSFEKPLAEMPERMISAEVVLAIADGLINNVDVALDGSGLSVAEVQSTVRDVLSFLEPHGLTPAYFDYLTVRLVQTDCLYDTPKVYALHQWTNIMAQLRSMETMAEQPRRTPGLSFDSVLNRSEVEAGLLHQTLQACIESNLVAKAVETFTDIQKLVDGNKLEAIGEFLSRPVHPKTGFFTSRPTRGQPEFTSSYGQLPNYKLSPLLNMVTDARLFGLGDWLLFSKDVDGAVLPSSTWAAPSLAIAVVRYAAAKKDASLVNSMFTARKYSNRKPTVNFLRAMAIYYIDMCDWQNAMRLLRDLQRSEGGGYNPKIVAHLAATILRLEGDPVVFPDETSNSDLSRAISLLEEILEGRYDSRTSSFRTLQKKTFMQQVGYLLRLFENIPESSVQDIAHQLKAKFPVSNEANLAPDTFNVVFSAIVKTKGAFQGRNIWDLFCKDPRTQSVSGNALPGRDVLSEDDLLNEEDPELFHSQSPALEDPELSQAISPSLNPHLSIRKEHELGYPRSEIPFVEEDPNVASIVEQIDSSDVDESESELNPIVEPDMRTLQILVKGALLERQLWQRHGEQRHADLDELLRWAGSFYPAFHLSKEDIISEFRMPTLLPDEFSVPSHYPRLPSKALRRERSRLNLGKKFTRGASFPRLPGVQNGERKKP